MGVEIGIKAMATPSATPTAPVRGRSAVNLEDLFIFMTAASAALPAVAVVRQVTALERAAAVATAPERPLVAVPDAHARFAALIESYDRLIKAIVTRVARSLGFSRDTFL